LTPQNMIYIRMHLTVNYPLCHLVTGTFTTQMTIPQKPYKLREGNHINTLVTDISHLYVHFFHIRVGISTNRMPTDSNSMIFENSWVLKQYWSLVYINILLN